MKYLIKQKLLSVGNDFTVLDENGKQAFYFDGKVLSIGTKIIVLDENNREVAVIRKKFLTFRPTFVVKTRTQILAYIYKKLLSFRKVFVIDVPGPDDITIVGSVLEHDYTFYRNGKLIAEVSKKWFREKDTYGIDVGAEKDVLLILSAAIIIDLMCHPKRDSGFNG